MGVGLLGDWPPVASAAAAAAATAAASAPASAYQLSVARTADQVNTVVIRNHGFDH